MHVNEKGQVTIPKDIREKYGFLPFTEVDFAEINNKVVLVKNKKPSRGLNIIKALRKRGDIKCTTDEIMRYTRG